jgi:hypothetical protein
MMRGVNAAFIVTGALYFAVSISGFAALGVGTGSNIILSLTNGPLWVRNVARIFVVVHVLAAYQVRAAALCCSGRRRPGLLSYSLSSPWMAASGAVGGAQACAWAASLPPIRLHTST